MLQIETTQIFDATKKMGCGSCPLHSNCNKYQLVCEFVKNDLFFCAELICILERAESSAMNVIYKCKKEKLPNVSAKAQTAYKDFLPAINNYLNAFYKYECEHVSEYEKRALILAIAESLEYWDLLKHFDFVFSHDIENTRDLFLAHFEYEMTKSENEKLAEQKATQNNTTK